MNSQEQVSTVPVIENRSFERERIPLEAAAYKDCTFSKCDIAYSGGQADLVGNKFENCRFHFEGAAGRTVMLLRALFNMEGDGSTRRMVEDLLKPEATGAN